MTDNAQMADERTYNLEEKHIPAWVVMEAVGKAIDEDVKGIESRTPQTYAVMIDQGSDE